MDGRLWPTTKVVRKMGILGQSSNYQNCIKKTNKIPEYARNYKNEYLFIRGINKTCEDFVKILDQEEGEKFNTSKAKKMLYCSNKFLKAQELINDISKLYLEEKDVRFIECVGLHLDDYMDLFINPDSYEFDQERYENDNSGLKDLYESFSKFKGKLKIKEMTYSEFKESLNYLDSDSDEVDIYSLILNDYDSD